MRMGCLPARAVSRGKELESVAMLAAESPREAAAFHLAWDLSSSVCGR